MDSELWKYENICFAEGYAAVCGVDEAGRGPLAGPVYAAAVILPPGLDIEGLNDSKKLSDKKRRELFPIIRERSLACCVSSASPEEIDRLNILNASFLAMRRAVEGLSLTPDIALIDGNRATGFSLPVRTIIKGDSLSASIAAASILAKVSRDDYMEKMDGEYPQYAFSKHKGYPTRLHYERIFQYGPSVIHRRSFLKNLEEHR